MENLYFVFENSPHSYTVFDLKGVYTHKQYEAFVASLKVKAENNVLAHINGYVENKLSPLPQKPNCPPDVEQWVKELKKQSNAFRLAGDFDAFITTNARIRALNKLLKEKKQYEKAQKQHELIKHNAKNMEMGYEDAVKKELANITRNLIVMTCKVEPRCDNYLIINLYRETAHPHLLEHITFNVQKNIQDYPSYIRLMRKNSALDEQYQEKIRSARKHYHECRHVLDSSQEAKRSMDYRKNFKQTVDAYYHLEQMNREYEEFQSRNADQEAAMRDNYHKICSTITIPVDTECNIKDRFARTELKNFGARVPLELQ